MKGVIKNMKGSTFWQRVLAVFMSIAVLATLIPAGVSFVNAESADVNINMGDLTVVKLDIKITSDDETKDLSDMGISDTVKNGDVVSLNFDWTLSNSVTTNQEISIDISSISKGISWGDTSSNPLKDPDGNDVGSYYISNGILYMTVTDSTFLEKDNKRGYLSLDGTINIDKDKNDGDEVEVGLGTYTKTLTFDAETNDSTVTTSKSLDGSVYKEGDIYKQKFKVRFEAKSNDITLESLVDQAGSGLSDMSEVTVTSSNISGISGNYDSLDALKNGIGTTMTEGQYVELEYTMTVDESVYEQNPSWNKFTNEFSVGYYSAKEPTIHKKASSYATVSASKPSVQKSGSWKDQENGIAEWTITIDLSAYKDELDSGKTFADLVSNIQDIPQNINGEAWIDGSVPSISPADFKATNPNEPYKYTYTFTTEVTSDVVNSVDQLEIKNKATADINGYTYSGSGSIKTQGHDWKLTKTFVGYDEDAKTLTWDVVVGTIPSKLTGIELVDDPYSGIATSSPGSHYITKIELKTSDTKDNYGDNGFAVVASRTSSSDDFTIDNSIISKISYDTYYHQEKKTILFQDSYIQSQNVVGKYLVVRYTTKITDSSVKDYTYLNTASLKTLTDNDYFKLKTMDLISKDGEAVEGENAIAYKVLVNLTDLDDLNADTPIDLTDYLPAGTKLNTSSVTWSVCYKSAYNVWYDKSSSSNYEKYIASAEYDTSSSLTKPVFHVTVTDDMLANIATYQTWNTVVYIQLEYEAEITDADFVKNGVAKSFTNHVSGTYSETSIGEAEKTVTVTPQKVGEKTVTYNGQTAPYAEYEIDVNPKALDLSSTDTLTATDTLGSQLSHDLTSIKVQAEQANGTWRTLKTPDDYTYSYVPSTNTVTFKLPDATHLKITYKAHVDIPAGQSFTSEGSKNTFKLAGMSEGSGSDETEISGTAVQSDGGTYADVAKIYFDKFYTDLGQYTALAGARFALTEYVKNSKGEWVEQAVSSGETYSYDDTKARHTLDNLEYDHIYILREVQAPDNFKQRTEPFYFVVRKDTNSTYEKPDGIEIQECTYGTSIPYENEEAQKEDGTLILEKTIAGIQAADLSAAISNIAFTVKDESGTEIAKVNLKKDFTYKSGKYVLTTPLQVEKGIYTVEETTYNVDGYAIQSITYAVNGGKTGDAKDKQVEVTVAGGDETTIAFTDTYTAITGKLVIQKTINGITKSADVTLAKNSIVFTVKNKDTNKTESYKLADFDYDAVSKTYYKEFPYNEKGYDVSEASYDVDGYLTGSVTYSLNGAAAVSAKGQTVAVTVPIDSASIVAFTDNYTEIDGKAVITKTIAGITKKTDIEKAEKSIAFTVVNKSTDKSQTYKLSEFTKTGDTYSLELPYCEAGYTVTESTYDVKGYEIVSVVYTLDGSSQNGKGKSVAVTVPTTGTNTIAYVNTYTEASTEDTTTEDTSTTEATTTEDSSTTEATTTEDSSTTEATTTEDSSTTEATTTEDSSTTEVTTTEGVTTETTTSGLTTTATESTSQGPTTGDRTWTQLVTLLGLISLYSAFVLLLKYIKK